jgi:hypothetical protein
MQFIPEAIGMQKAAHEHFGFGVLTLYPAHVIAALFLGMYICHSAKLAKNQVKTPNKPSLFYLFL